MRRPAIFVGFLLLSACSPLPLSRNAVERMKNPLYAEQYYAELVDHFVGLQIHKDPALKDTDITTKADKARKEALRQSQEAAAVVDEGSIGFFSPAAEEMKGAALALGGKLYIGPDFLTIPGADLRIYATRMVDPREGTFPDETAQDLGPLDSPYGDQVYRLSGAFTDADQFTVVVFDRALKRVHGFAQVRP